MNPTTTLPPPAVNIPCGTDCVYASPLRGSGGEWVACAQPDRTRYVAHEDRECRCFCPHTGSERTPPPS